MTSAAQFWIGVAVCWAVCAGVWMLASRWMRRAEARKMQRRLMGASAIKMKSAENKAPALLSQEDETTGRLVQKLLARFPVIPTLRDWLEQAGLRWHPARLLHLCLALFLLAVVAVWQAAPGWERAAPVVGAATGSLPLAYVLRRRSARLRRFEEQFPESLEFVARSMRAGHAFSVALEMLHKEFPEPLSGEFRRAFEEHNLGLPLEAALQKLAQRVPLMDVKFFVSAVTLQRRTGGNLAELLDKLAYVIRERFKLRGRLRAVTAHGRMTGATLTLIPVGVACVLFLINREYVRFFLNDPTGQALACGAVLLQAVGYAIIRKIVSIEV
ncbi:MAG: type II secretion system F family protein [Bryobacteraceae bacterium]